MVKSLYHGEFERLADVLVHYSLGEQIALEGKKVQIVAEDCASPVVEMLVPRIVHAGGHPLPIVQHRPTYLAWLGNASAEQIAAVPAWERELAEEADASLRIMGTEHPQELRLYADKLEIYWKARSALVQTIMSKPWCVFQFPTKAQARQNGFTSHKDYVEFVLAACTGVDYRAMRASLQDLKGLIDESSEIRLVTYDAAGKAHELTMEYGTNIAEIGDGRKNMPDGEIFTCPYPATVEGTLASTFPVSYNGTTMSDFTLEFQRGEGKILSVKRGKKELERIIQEGKFLGECSLGTNAAVPLTTKLHLLIEKAGGVVAVAIGRSLDEAYPELIGKTPQERKVVRERLIDEGKYSGAATQVDFPIDFCTQGSKNRIMIGRKEVIWSREGKQWEIQ